MVSETAPRRATLTDLPAELLVQIFAPLTLSPKPIPVCPCQECSGRWPSRRWSKSQHRRWEGVPVLPGTTLLSLLLIHRSVASVASELFFARNEFLLIVHSCFVRSAVRAVDKGLFGSGGSLRRVRSLTVEVETRRAFVRELVAPALEDMAANGRLRRLKVKLFERAAGAGCMTQGGQGIQPSVLALLRAMDAVPGGEARLYSHRRSTDGGRMVGWGRGMSPAAYDLPGTLGVEQVNVVEVDWRAMLEDERGREKLGGDKRASLDGKCSRAFGPARS